MEKTQNFFEKVRELLKKYRFNWETQKVEHDEIEEIEHVNHWLGDDMRKTFRMRSSAVVVSAFLVLVGAGVVDAQTRAYEVLYNGNSIGYVNDPKDLETAVKTIGNVSVSASDYEIRPARSSDLLTSEEVAQTISDIKTQETVLVATFKNVNQTPVTSTTVATPVVEATAVETPVADTTIKEATRSVASIEEMPVTETTAVETPAVAAPVVAAAQVEAPVVVAAAQMEEPAVEATVAEVPEIPAVADPVAETPVAVAPVTEAPVVETAVPETPVTEAPAVEIPVVTPAVETPAVETPAVETPQAQFILPASGRIGEILRDYDGGYYSNHYRAAAVDILNSEGTSVYAAASGTVTLSSWYGGYGKCVIIDHGNGYSTLYGHFSSVDVSEGQTVTQGQRIGGMGSTGSSTANHVHFEVRMNSEAQPIINYFSINTGDYI